jgi:hypothetical protein
MMPTQLNVVATTSTITGRLMLLLVQARAIATIENPSIDGDKMRERFTAMTQKNE